METEKDLFDKNKNCTINNRNKLFSDLIMFLGLTIIQFLSILFILTQLLFYFNVCANITTLTISILLSYIILLLSIYYEYTIRDSVQNVIKKVFLLSSLISIILIFIFAISIIFANMFIDVSFDANMYHTPYSAFFVNGWNPIIDDKPPDLSNGRVKTIDVKNNSYPKAAEIIASYVYLITHSIESVKAINLIIFVSSFIISFFAFFSFVPQRKIIAIVFSFLATLNPVWITQSTEFFIDGFTYQLSLILLSLILIYIKRDHNGYIFLSLLLTSILLFNTKGTSLLFIPLFMIMFFILVRFYYKHLARNVIIFLLILLGFSLITGYSPYIVNYVKYKSPLGAEFSGVSAEAYLKEYSGYTNNLIPSWLVPTDLFIKSLFSSPSQNYKGIKNPLNIQLSELDGLTGENRINGYGPLCGLIILVSILLFIWLVVNKHNLDVTIISICILFIFFSVILNPACWWARMVPQFFLIPVLIGFCGFINASFFSKLLSAILSIIILTNIILVGFHTYTTSDQITKNFDNLIMNIHEKAQFPVGLNNTYQKYYPDLFSPVSTILLDEKGIPWEICGKDVDCNNFKEKATLIFFTDILYN